jgi:hypothetical protein
MIKLTAEENLEILLVNGAYIIALCNRPTGAAVYTTDGSIFNVKEPVEFIHKLMGNI